MKRWTYSYTEERVRRMVVKEWLEAWKARSEAAREITRTDAEIRSALTGMGTTVVTLTAIAGMGRLARERLSVSREVCRLTTEIDKEITSMGHGL